MFFEHCLIAGEGLKPKMISFLAKLVFFCSFLFLFNMVVGENAGITNSRQTYVRRRIDGRTNVKESSKTTNGNKIDDLISRRAVVSCECI